MNDGASFKDSYTTQSGISYRVLDVTAPWESVSGIPVVFQHGLGLDGTAWHPWMQQLASSHPIVSIDLRGHGNSREVSDDLSEEIGSYVQDVLDVLSALHVDRCHFVGESFGGTIGLFLAAHHGARVESLTIASTGWHGKLVKNIDDWTDVPMTRRGVHKWAKAMAKGSFDEELSDPRVRDWAYNSYCAMRPQSIISVARCLKSVDLSSDLDKIVSPVLNIVAHQSPFVPVDQSVVLGSALARYEQVDILDAKHRVFITHADRCADELVGFLSRHEGP